MFGVYFFRKEIIHEGIRYEAVVRYIISLRLSCVIIIMHFPPASVETHACSSRSRCCPYLVTVLMPSLLDYCNFILAGLPTATLVQSQTVLVRVANDYKHIKTLITCYSCPHLQLPVKLDWCFCSLGSCELSLYRTGLDCMGIIITSKCNVFIFVGLSDCMSVKKLWTDCYDTVWLGGVWLRQEEFGFSDWFTSGPG